MQLVSAKDACIKQFFPNQDYLFETVKSSFHNSYKTKSNEKVELY